VRSGDGPPKPTLVVHEAMITSNVPGVYMARDVMILMRENPFRGPLERGGPGNGNERSECHLGPKIFIE
jgi:hypothetical protein